MGRGRHRPERDGHGHRDRLPRALGPRARLGRERDLYLRGAGGRQSRLAGADRIALRPRRSALAVFASTVARAEKEPARFAVAEIVSIDAFLSRGSAPFESRTFTTGEPPPCGGVCPPPLGGCAAPPL